MDVWFIVVVESLVHKTDLLHLISIRNLKYLSPCSILANILEFVGKKLSWMLRVHTCDWTFVTNGAELLLASWPNQILLETSYVDLKTSAHFLCQVLASFSISSLKLLFPAHPQYHGSHLQQSFQFFLELPSLLLKESVWCCQSRTRWANLK